ncbi:MAG TPA: gamma carbonic anhydrase family protein [Bacteroidota bacterium]|jgi:carbonic anhydrase/acetyltransferase-like protein (isoleucine patch superfamily)
MIHPYRGTAPAIHESAFLCASAEIIGDVEIGQDSSVWFNAVIRGDVNSIRIGERTNIQDGCLLHVTHAKFPLRVGKNVTVGHGAILHGCTVGDFCLIGMGAIVLDNARINSYTLLAAGSVVRPGTLIPEGVMAAGVPARVVRKLSPEERLMLEESAQHYVDYVKTYRDAT